MEIQTFTLAFCRDPPRVLVLAIVKKINGEVLDALPPLAVNGGEIGLKHCKTKQMGRSPCGINCWRNAPKGPMMLNVLPLGEAF